MMLPEFQNTFAGGMNDSPGLMRRSSNQGRRIANMRLQEDGSAKVRDGSKYTHATVGMNGVPAVISSFRTSAGADVWVFVERTSARIYTSTDYGATWNNLLGVAPTTGPVTFAVITDAGVRKLAIAGFPGVLYVLTDATTIAQWTVASTQIPTANPAFIAAHGDRLWLCEADSQTLYGSKVADPDCWTSPDGLVLPIGGDGEPMRGLFPIGTGVLVFKESSIAYVDGYGNSDIIVGSGARGIPIGESIFPKTCVRTPYGTIVSTSGGIFSFSMQQGMKLLSKAVSELVGDLRWDMLADPYPLRGSVPVAVYLPQSHEYVVSMQSSSQSVGYYMDRLIRLNLKTGAIVYDEKAGDQICAMMAAQTHADDGTKRLVTIGPAGLSRVHDVAGTYTDDTTSAGAAGTAYSGVVETRVTAFGKPGRKRLRRVAVKGDWGAGGGTMSVLATADAGPDGAGRSSNSKTLTFAAIDKVQSRVAGLSLRGEQFFVRVTAVPTATYRPRIEGVNMYASPMLGGRDISRCKLSTTTE